MPTLRTEFHRLREGTTTPSRREVGSSVWQVFDGRGEIVVGDQVWRVERGDLVVVPSWEPWELRAETPLDLFRFSDAPVIERLAFDRTFVAGRER
jgi:gentisate 1,2-dioxygenase